MTTNLIKIDDFKVYKGINSENEDPTISLLIGSVSEFVVNYIGRSLIGYSLKDKVEYFNGTNYHSYYPDEWPLISVTSLETSLDGGITYTALTENTDFFVDLENDTIQSNTAGLDKFVVSSIAHRSCKLTYKGGYETTPSDIQLAIMDIVEHYRKKEYIPTSSLQGTSVENPVVFLQGNVLPPHIKRVLDNYRNI